MKLKHSGREVGDDLREQLLAGAPLSDRRMELAGVPTAVLEGGDGPSVVLLHGQGGWAGMWLPIVRDLVSTHHVVAPDLPGLGGSETPGGPPDADGVMAWLGELVDRICPTPPVLVGISLGGSIAARFAAMDDGRLSGLILADTGGLVGGVRPAPRVMLALVRHGVRPSERSTLGMLRQVTVDLDRLGRRMGAAWDPFLAYLVDRSRTPGVRKANRRLLRELGFPRIPPEDLARIGVPTALLWGRHDRVMPLRAAERAGDAYGWPLHVIEDAGHLVVGDQPEAFLGALRTALAEGGAS